MNFSQLKSSLQKISLT